jgi:hypothetical protein
LGFIVGFFRAKLCALARIIPAIALPCSKNGRRWIAQGDKRPVYELRFGFSISQWAPRVIANDPARRAQLCAKGQHLKKEHRIEKAAKKAARKAVAAARAPNAKSST